MRNRSPRAFRLLCAAFLLLITAGSWPALAQGPTGVIEGVVRDEQGGRAAGCRHDPAQPGDWRHPHAGDRSRRPLQLPRAFARHATSCAPSWPGSARPKRSRSSITIGLGAAPGRHDAGSDARREHDRRRRSRRSSTPRRPKSSGIVTQEQIETLPINSRQYLSLALLVPGTTVDATRSFFATVNVGGVDDLQRHRQRRRRHDQQLGRGRRAAPGSAGGRGRGVQGHQRLLQGGVRPGHRRRRAGGDQVGHQPASRHRVRVLPRQGAQRARRVRGREAGLSAATSSAAAPAARSSRTSCTSSARSSGPTPRSSTPSAPASRSSTARSRARSRCRPTRNLYSARGDWQISNSQNAFARYLGAGRRRRRARAAAAPARRAATRRSRAGRSSPATPGFAARAR